jgi:hypothetical protein
MQKSVEVLPIPKVQVKLTVLGTREGKFVDTLDWQLHPAALLSFSRSRQTKPDSGSICTWPRKRMIPGAPDDVEFRVFNDDSITVAVLSLDSLMSSFSTFIPKGYYQFSFVDLRHVSGMYLIRIEARDSQILAKRVRIY